METASLYIKNPNEGRFVAGGMNEVEALLGAPLPRLPPPEMHEGQNVYLVRFHPQLRAQARKYLQALMAQIGLDTAVSRRQDTLGRDQADFEVILTRVLRSVRQADRRLGLINLFWLAHTRDIAECLRDLEARAPAVRKLKYYLHPLLSSFYRQVEQSVRAEMAEQGGDEYRILAGPVENPSLIDSLIEDGFAFTEVSIKDLDFNQFLATNKRYRLSADVFFEIYSLLLRETERRLRDGDRILLGHIARQMPALAREQYLTQAGITKIVLNSHVLTYLFGDVWNTGVKMMAANKLNAEGDRRKPAETVDAFVELMTHVKRFEILSHLRDRVVLLKPFGDDSEDRLSKGLMHYDFGESTQVSNNVVNATVLFLDLRGFTKTSEGIISERDLTQELYKVFDSFVPIVRRFGGTIDKFLGDGIMMTFSTEHADPLDPVNALRVAILCQEALQKLREAGQTYFRMGVAIHYGRVYLAHFIADESRVQHTIIGRNVNLAGRLSSASLQPMDGDEDSEPLPILSTSTSGLHVSVNGEGALCNEGIALSRDTLHQIESALPLLESDAAGPRELHYFDETIGRKIVIRYVGDAKFKGVASSVPVYEADYE